MLMLIIFIDQIDIFDTILTGGETLGPKKYF